MMGLATVDRDRVARMALATLVILWGAVLRTRAAPAEELPANEGEAVKTTAHLWTATVDSTPEGS